MTDPAAAPMATPRGSNFIAIVLLEEILEQVVHVRRTQTEHTARLHALTKEIRMASQAEIDAITNALANLKDSLVADDAAIQAEITALQTANPTLDLTGLQGAVTDLGAAVDATTALVPAPTA